MVETMVSVFVLALGVIGASAMQLNALRTVQESGLQTSSLQIARDIADMIRRPGMSGDVFAQAFVGLDYDASGAHRSEQSDRCAGITNNCNVVELAGSEIEGIKYRISESLPNGRIKICHDAEPWDDGNRQYRWDCSDGGNGQPIAVKIGWRGKADEQIGEQATEKSYPPRVVLLISGAKGAL